ncbi:hypothetical protein CC86DRAFT_343967 [Ophiobolus disseminans]|uniref:Mid2 domain-containing protein n=1 Tax=Ophiobolus disseminans TaxID=1469910 RepID=A0A6A7ACB7_9PLEO|nr:hypothetical protein CC86DRAFT_343967 [Ophiobolus disseminans]
MMFAHTICVLLAPALTSAAAFPWDLPQPTRVAPAPDNWSPAPTRAPQLLGFELFKRQAQGSGGDRTCGFISGLSASSITCSSSNFICATNTYNGVHGCCDSAAMDACIIPTTCIGSAAMSKLCTDSTCFNNPATLKCTESAATECYKWIIQYSKTSMTQHGCTNKGFTESASRAWGVSSIPKELYRTTTVLVTPSSSPTPTLTPSTDPAKPGLGAIIGGTIGGCTVVSIIVLVAFLLHRRRKKARDSIKQRPITQFHPEGVTEYNPNGFPTPKFSNNDAKWEQHQGPVTRPSDAMPHYPGMGPAQYGIVEVDGLQRPVEAPAEITYHAREYVRSP